MRSIRPAAALTLGTLALFLAGCSRNPVAPQAAMSGEPGAQPLSSSTREEEPMPPQSGGTSNTATATLAAGAEASLTVGRFTLRLHKNTLQMPTTFVLHVANEAATEVEIQVTPPEANQLQVAGELTANVSDLPSFNYDTATMLTWDGGAWVEVADAAAHSNQQNVVARLHTLTKCKLGERAGKKKTASE